MPLADLLYNRQVSKLPTIRQLASISFGLGLGEG